MLESLLGSGALCSRVFTCDRCITVFGPDFLRVVFRTAGGGNSGSVKSVSEPGRNGLSSSVSVGDVQEGPLVMLRLLILYCPRRRMIRILRQQCEGTAKEFKVVQGATGDTVAGRENKKGSIKVRFELSCHQRLTVS